MADARAPSGGAGPPAGTKSKHSRGVNLNLADRAERAAKAKAVEQEQKKIAALELQLAGAKERAAKALAKVNELEAELAELQSEEG